MKQDCVYYDDDQISINIPQRLYEAVNSYPFVDVCGEELNLVLLDKLLLSTESAMFRIQEAGKPGAYLETISCDARQIGRHEKSNKRSRPAGDK